MPAAEATPICCYLKAKTNIGFGKRLIPHALPAMTIGYLQADDLAINNATKAGTARKVKLTFKDVPILYTPWINFSFSGERKSGMLAPLYGYTARTGIDLTVPFYWNIAPNYDATFSTRAMSQARCRHEQRIPLSGNQLK